MANKKLTEEEVKHIAKLANLPLTENEVQQHQQQLSNILQYVEKLQELDTDEVEITSQVTGLTNVYRQDEVDEGRMLSQQEALSNTPESHNGYVVVPAVIEKE